MKKKNQKTIIKVDIDDKGKLEVSIKQGRFTDMRLWGSLLADVANTVAEAHQSVENPQKTMELIRMGFIEGVNE